MLKPGIDIKRIIVLTGYTDLRRGIDGMVSIVKLRYGLNPVEKGALFLFCGTKKDRIKGIFLFISVSHKGNINGHTMKKKLSA
jgi:transposase